MSVEITCRCGTRFRVNEKLQGRRVKCPTCGHVTRVPDPRHDSLAQTMVQPATASPNEPPPRTGHDSMAETLIAPQAGLDDLLAAPASARPCPHCGASVPGDQIVCPHCGHNVETGVHLADSSQMVRRSHPRGDFIPAWLTAAGGVASDLLARMRIGGPRATVSGSTFLAVIVVIALAVLYYWSNSDSGRAAHLRSRLPGILREYVVDRQGVNLESEGMLAAVQLGNLKFVRSDDGSRYAVDADLVVGTGGEFRRFGHARGNYYPGPLLMGLELHPTQIELDIHLDDSFYHWLKVPPPKSVRTGG